MSSKFRVVGRHRVSPLPPSLRVFLPAGVLAPGSRRTASRSRHLAGTLFILALLSTVAPAGRADDAAGTRTAFAPRPPDHELAPRNADERDASVIILDYRIEFGGAIRNWSGRHASTKRHRARYLIRDNRGVEVIKQHTFFGDESNAEITEVRGQTLSPDGSAHPVHPERDIQQLDIAIGKRKRQPVRTVTFPRVEPGAILDLAWTETGGYPEFETIGLSLGFPTRHMRIKAQGKLSGGSTETQPGFGQQTYWVPFLISRAPAGTAVRLSSLMDLELTATNLPVRVDEPLAPPAIRAGAMLGLIPKHLPGRKWREHVYLLDEHQPLPEQQESEVVWVDASLDANEPFVEFDELGLQVVPQSLRDAKVLESLRFVLKTITQGYGRFVRGNKSGETAAQLEAVAPASVDWNARVDRIFRYAREQVRLDPESRDWNRLDRLRSKGFGNGKALRYYVKYLLDTAGIDNDLVFLISRRDVPFLTIFESWLVYATRDLLIEVRAPGGAVRYLQPADILADAWSFGDGYLGGILFRDSGDPDTAWSIDRVPTAAEVRERRTVRFAAKAEEAAAGTGKLLTTIELHGPAANRMRWTMGRRTAQTEPDELEERRMDYLRGYLESWAGTELPEDFSIPVTEPDANVWEPYSLTAAVPWHAGVQPLDDRMILPAFPRASLFLNLFVAERRRNPLWLAGGEFEISMTWELPAGKRPAQLQRREAGSPGGLGYRLEQSWDEMRSALTSTLHLRQPYLLPASAYPQARSVFAGLQRDSRLSVLVEPVR